VAAYGDGWYGFNLARSDVADRVGSLRERIRRADRDPAEVDITLSLRDGAPEDLGALAELGVDELVLVDSPPGRAEAVRDWTGALAERWATEPHGGT
jgi:alkanesulfonate monooxygenase SsuD/methylene tetrahydromethanopterin reductase-like flavin-dependent oxidoreductase (luciferase family)